MCYCVCVFCFVWGCVCGILGVGWCVGGGVCVVVCVWWCGGGGVWEEWLVGGGVRWGQCEGERMCSAVRLCSQAVARALVLSADTSWGLERPTGQHVHKRMFGSTVFEGYVVP